MGAPLSKQDIRGRWSLPVVEPQLGRIVLSARRNAHM